MGAKLEDLPESARETLRNLVPGCHKISVDNLPCNPWLTSGIWRVCCGDRCLVLKELRPPDNSDASVWGSHWTARAELPSHWNYWKREALVYGSEATEFFSDFGLRPPTALGLEVSQNRAYLWIENVDAPSAASWGPRRYAKAAYQLGNAQGHIVSTGSFPKHKWLSVDYLADYSGEKPFEFGWLDDDIAWRQPLVADYFPPGLRDGARRFASHKDELLRIAARLPRTLCHNDFWTRNLLGTDVGDTFLIDWAFLGSGCIGQDIGNLVPSAAFDGFAPPQELPALERMVFESYNRGLRKGGCKEERLALLGMYASAVKYVWVCPAMLSSASDARHPVYVGYGDSAVEDQFLRVGRVLEFLVSWADHAMTLSKELKF